MEIIAGRNPVLEALRSGRTVKEVLITPEGRGPVIKEIKRMAERKNIPIKKVERSHINQLAEGKNHQGIVARVRPRTPWKIQDLWDKEDLNLVLALDQIQDPQNLGAIIRSAAFFGADGVVLPKDRSAPFTEAAQKASSGGWEWVPVVEVTNLARTIDEFKEKNFWVSGGEQKASQQVWEVDYTDPTLLVIGSEGKGLRSLTRKKCDHLVSIPGGGEMGSLNASVAAGIFLYEVIRQRNGLFNCP